MGVWESFRGIRFFAFFGLGAALLSGSSAFADYYGDSYGGGNGGGYGSYGGNYGGSYGGSYYGGGSRSAPIISLELDSRASLNSSLRVAARENRLNDLQRIIKQGGEINGQSSTGETALIYAARNCSVRIVAYLLSLRGQSGNLRVNVNLRDHLGRTAVMYAAADSCAPVTKLLLEVPELELGLSDRYGRTIKDYALYGAELEMGGPASETYALIRDAEKSRLRRRIAKLVR